MNTLANHGYIPRNGVASFEEITLGVMEAFNLGVTMAVGMVAQNMLTRGNMFADKISIGGVSTLVPPLPFQLDGPVTGGLAKHGRVEGDASMTRADAFIGDNVHFQDMLYDLDLLQLGKFGDNGPDGNNTVFNVATLIGMKQQNIAMDQAANPMFALPARRVNTAFAGAATILHIFANGTTKQATLPIIGSFFRNQTFPPNWFRSATPINSTVLVPTIAQLQAAIPIVPGHNDAGVYVADPAPPPPWNSSFACFAYYDQAANIPGTIVNTTGIFKKNVDLLTGILFNGVSANPGCARIDPFGPTGV
ncbi:Chloroperoxidase [Mycena rosella]|uniref:Chloroperoxidase n=1 Tax=Mycena rosella TaxID=1033263 RepID=A0AAD7D9P0_MYCRO|nr:Chloroperoxidase [Mycena rosella]